LQGQGYLYRFDHGDNINKALKAFQAAIEIDSNYADAYVGLAEAKRKEFIRTKNNKFLNSMRKTVEQLTEVDRHHKLLGYLQGELLLNQGDYIGAIKLFEKSIQQQANFFMSYSGLSQSYLKLGEIVKAEQTLLNAYKLMPNNNLILITLGSFYFKNGDYHQALDYFKLLAIKTPNNYIAFLNVSACYYLNGELEKAIFAAKEALMIQPNFMVYSNIGTYYFILRDYVQAVEAFEEMIALNDSDYINWGNLADAYRFSNNAKYSGAFKQAIKLALKTIELNPNQKYTIALLAYYYANLGEVEKTKYYANKINEKDLGENQFFIAAAFARLNMHKAALRYVEFAINNSYSIAEITSSPLLDNLNNEPKYLRLISNDEK
jgi:serine/threonine-protein kinase